MYVLCGNYGNETIAVIEWAKQQSLSDVYVVHVDTGWAASCWAQRVQQGVEYVRDAGFQSVALRSPLGMSESVKDRGSFPSQKYQWCPIQLKGLALLEWLDQQDDACEAVMLLGKRRCQSAAPSLMQQHEPESELHGDRDVWYPLTDVGDQQFTQLIKQAGFDVLPHRSLECDPYIHSTAADFRRLDAEAIKRTQQLEQAVSQTMFEKPIEQMVSFYRQSASDGIYQQTSAQDMGCGSPYACGE